MVTAYSFIVRLSTNSQTYEKPEEAQIAVDKMDNQTFQGNKLVVEIAGVKKNKSGPQPDDVCRSCGGKGHW
jgi:RNA recognition motif-containing protein